MARSSKSQNKEKLSRKEKAEMKIESEKMKSQLKTIVLPTFGVVCLLIIAYVVMKTRSIAAPAADL